MLTRSFSQPPAPCIRRGPPVQSMLHLILVLIIFGLFLCICLVFWLWHIQKHYLAWAKAIQTSMDQIQRKLNEGFQGRISQETLSGLMEELKSLLKKSQRKTIRIPLAERTDAASRFMPRADSTFSHQLDVFGLDKPILVLDLSDRLKNRLPEKIHCVMDLFKISNDEMNLPWEAAHELNCALIKFVTSHLQADDTFKRVLNVSVCELGLPRLNDDPLFESLSDVLKHRWESPESEIPYAKATRILFSKYILDRFVPGFAEIRQRRIHSFQLSTRVKNLLHASSIQTVEDLISQTRFNLKRKKKTEVGIIKIYR